MDRRQIFLEHVAQTSNAPLMLEIERAEGCFLYDAQGKKYLDLISGISVSSLGHNNRRIKKAIHDQLEKYSHTMVYGEFVQGPQTDLAAYLTALLPSGLSSVYFANSGTEAVEGAMKLVKRYTGRSEIMSFSHSYHGSTQGALSLGNTENRKNAFRPLLPGNRILTFNDQRQIDLITDKCAAVIMEPVQAEAGVILPAPGYLQQIRDRCSETGTLLVFDEIQTGCGRTGSLFAFQKYGVIPDILCLGKAFGGGMPLAAFISGKECMDKFTFDPPLGHISTFGGHPVCCAAGLASLREIVENDLSALAGKKGALFSSMLKHPSIKEVRSSGLLIAVELENADTNFALQSKLLEEGLLTDWFLFAPQCMRIAPPLIISEQEITHACKTICTMLDTVT